MERMRNVGMGWVRDYPDFRDYDLNKASPRLAKVINEYRTKVRENEARIWGFKLFRSTLRG